MSIDQVETTRKTYAIIDFISDCGGLFSGLFTLGQMLANPFQLLVFKRRLAENVVK